jgi:hypothetical protein
MPDQPNISSAASGIRVAALYVETGGVYYGLPDVDPWDEQRDARLYAGPWPVVAHPPCQRWSTLAAQIQTRFGYVRGDDGGCFESGLDSVRRWGGVLEHPAHSYAWSHFGLPRPLRDGGWAQSMTDEGWSCWVDQGWYGHPYKKPTWLYAVGIELPAIRWGRGPGAVLPKRNLTMSEQGRKRVMLPTPPAFRDVLLDMARSASRERSAA